MAKLIINKNEQRICVTKQFNLFYRLTGLIVLSGSLYLLLYPVITGEDILYRGELNLKYFSAFGFILAIFAYWEDRFIANTETDVMIVSHGLSFLALYKKAYVLSSFNKMLLSVDDEAPNWASTDEIHDFVKPWYRIAITSNDTDLGTELVIAKSTNPEETKVIAEMISDYSKIPLELSPHYPV